MNKRKIIRIAIGLVSIVSIAIGGTLFVESKLSMIERVEASSSLGSDNGNEAEIKEVSNNSSDNKIYDKNIDNDTKETNINTNVEIKDIEFANGEDVLNILLIGQDRRPGEERQRSDSMIICTLNKNSDKILLTSVMRDLYVEIPGYGGNRINAAYAFGGMELLDETIESNFGVHIDGNVEVDFDGFISALSVIGNLDIELRQEEADRINENIPNPGNLVEGINSMNPEQLLDYARLRYVGNKDYERTERQRKILMKAFEKVKDSNIIEAIKLFDKIAPHLVTDMENEELLTCISYVVFNDIETVESHRVPVDGAFESEKIRGMEVLVPDLEVNSQYLYNLIYNKDYTSDTNDITCD